MVSVQLALILYIGLKACGATVNSTTNSTTSSLASTSIASASFVGTSTDTHTSEVLESSSSSLGRLGTFILQGLGASLSASPAISTSSSDSTDFTTHNVSWTQDSSALSSANTTGSASNQTLTSSSRWQSVQSCNSASISWRSAHTSDKIIVNSTSVFTTTLTRSISNGTVYTLCDHFPRMEVQSTDLITTSVATSTLTVRQTSSATCTTNCPSCTIDSQDCSALWSSWISGTASIGDRPACLSSSPSTSTSKSSTLTSTTSSSSPCGGNAFLGGSPCSFVAGPVRLVYFPPEIKGDRLCGNYTTVSPPSNITAPLTVQTFGTTFTSGTAYISFESLAAADACGTPTGTPMSNLFIPLPSSEVSSMCGANGGVFITGPTPTAVNYADLQTPIASDVYKCQPRCLWGGPGWTNLCPTIFDDYAPALAYPTQVKQLQSEWKDCGFESNEYFRYQYGQKYYLFDPPLALTKASSEAGVTLPATAAPQIPASPPKTTEPVSATPAQSQGDLPKPSPAETNNPPPPTSADITSVGDPAPVQSGSSNSPTTVPADPSPAALPSSTQGALGVLQSAVASAIGQIGASTQANDPGEPAQTLPSQASTGDPTAGIEQPTTAADPAQPQASGGSPVKTQTKKDPTIGGGLVIGGSSTIPLSSGQQSRVSLEGGGDPIAVSHDGSNYVVGGQTLTPGQVATVNGQQVSAMPAQDAGPDSPLSISRAGSAYVANGVTLTPGQVTTVNGQALSVGSGGEGVVRGSSTISLEAGFATAVAATRNIESALEVSRFGSAYFVDGETLTLGQATVVDGQTISLPAGGDNLYIGTSAIQLADSKAMTITSAPSIPTPMTISRSGSLIFLDGSTLTPGQTATISGELVSALSNGGGLVIGTRTIALSDGGSTTIAQPLALSRSGSAIFVDGTEIRPGKTTIIDGQEVSILSNGAGVLFGTSTLSLADGEATTIIPGPSLSAMGFIVIGGKTLTAYSAVGKSGEVIIDGKTLSMGGSAATIDGETLSFGSNGLIDIQSGHTSTVSLISSSVTSSSAQTEAGVASGPSSTTSSGRQRSEVCWMSMALLATLTVGLLLV